jgi:hypothetical protein
MSRDLFYEDNWGSVIGILGLVAVLLVAGVIYSVIERDDWLAGVSVRDARITLGEAVPEAVNEVSKDQSPEVFYHVVLRDVPRGWPLELDCEWQDPNGKVARRNHYRTRFIHMTTWATHCRQRFVSTSVPGEWHVQLRMGHRVLSSSAFLLR